MDLHSSNFSDHVDQLCADIRRAHFIAFDCEFTGLVTQNGLIEGDFADHREFYERIKETALNFNLLQLGVTVFIFEDGQYVPKPYNIRIAVHPREGYNKVVVAEWESLQFLTRNNMNWLATFRYGIEPRRINPDKRPKDTKYRHPVAQRPQVFYSEEDRKTINEIEEKIRGCENKKKMRVDFGNRTVLEYFRDRYDLAVDKPSKNMGKWEYEFRLYNYHGMKSIQFEKGPPTHHKELSKEDVGFMHKVDHGPPGLEAIFACIIEHKVPIVGYFPSLDLGLIYQAFIDDLPDDYEVWSAHLCHLFPYIFDLKVLSRDLQERMKYVKVGLKDMYRAVWNAKQLQPWANINFKGLQDYMKAENSHEAGYDSFMTGCAFVGVINFLFEQEKTHPIVFARAEEYNWTLNCRFAGPISLKGPIYCKRAERYHHSVVIYPEKRQEHDCKQIGSLLSKLGTVTARNNHGETYYVFEDPVDIEKALAVHEGLKRYEKRRIMRARNMFASQ